MLVDVELKTDRDTSKEEIKYKQKHYKHKPLLPPTHNVARSWARQAVLISQRLPTRVPIPMVIFII